MTSRTSLSMSLALGVAAVSLAGCDRAGDESAQLSDAASAPTQALSGAIDRSKAGTAMPALTVSHPAGEPLDLTSLTGTPVLINLWATWCAPCVVEMPMLDNLAAQMGEDLRVLTVSQDMSGATVVEPFFAERDFAHLEPWLDTENELMFRYSNSGQLPLTVLYDGAGNEVFRVAGAYHWDDAETVELIAEAIAE